MCFFINCFLEITTFAITIKIFLTTKIYTGMKKLMALMVVAGLTFVACNQKPAETEEVNEEAQIEEATEQVTEEAAEITEEAAEEVTEEVAE